MKTMFWVFIIFAVVVSIVYIAFLDNVNYFDRYTQENWDWIKTRFGVEKKSGGHSSVTKKIFTTDMVYRHGEDPA